MKKWSVAAVLPILLLAACASPTPQESAEIAAEAEHWMHYFEAGDIDALVGLYAEDARLLPPNEALLEGHDAIRAHLQGLMDTGLAGKLQTLEAMAAGDLGYRVGTYTLSTPEGEVADQGKYVEVWRRIDGAWKITDDAYNSDLPAGPAGQLMIGTHVVGDGAVWVSAWMDGETRREQFASHGVAGVRIFQDPENPNSTGLLLDVVDMDAFRTFLSSEEGAAAAAEDTVDLSAVNILLEVQ